jgi:hypothetical protein
MKKITLAIMLSFVAFVSKAQISTFDLNQSTLVYINYMPGEPGYDYDYTSPSEFDYQYNDLIEVGIILPVWKKFNANIGVGTTYNFQDPQIFSPTNYDYNVSSTFGQGLHLKTGLSYSLKSGNLKIMPNLGILWNTEANYGSVQVGNFGNYVIENTYLGTWGVFDAGIDVVYKNILVGLTFTDLGNYYNNYTGLGIKLGYSFTKKSKMKF